VHDYISQRHRSRSSAFYRDVQKLLLHKYRDLTEEDLEQAFDSLRTERRRMTYTLSWKSSSGG
jgi:hypothetical protein